jgi:alpha-methylacyl-CoA racemase
MQPTARQIIESIPLRFRPEKAEGFNTIFHFEITGDESQQFTVTIQSGTCTLTEGLTGAPNCVLSCKASTYINLETGKANPQMALMTGKVSVSNIAAMIRFSKCFRKFSTDILQQESNDASVEQTKRPEKSGPLAGVKIIDFTRLLPGPIATMFLADLGADVIKVEDPDNPDYIRDFEPQIGGTSAYYLALNRNKRSLAVNYLSAEGKQVILDLVKTADVLVEQFRPGIMESMGLGYETLKQINPKLIYVSITGYGQTGSMAQAAGHDLNYIAIAGALGITGTPNGKPVIPGFQLADIAGGGYMAMNAVTAALYQREKTGKGEYIDVSMTDAVLPFSALAFAANQSNQSFKGLGNTELSGGLPNYNVYKCADGKYIALGSLEPKFWGAFCNKVDKPEWSNKQLGSDVEIAQLKEEVQQLFSTKTSGEWLRLFEGEDICLTKINEPRDLAIDTYLQERGMFIENEHPAVGKYKTINQPLKFKGATFGENWPAPVLGSDTSAILNELGYATGRVIDLANKQVIKL